MTSVQQATGLQTHWRLLGWSEELLHKTPLRCLCCALEVCSHFTAAGYRFNRRTDGSALPACQGFLNGWSSHGKDFIYKHKKERKKEGWTFEGNTVALLWVNCQLLGSSFEDSEHKINFVSPEGEFKPHLLPVTLSVTLRLDADLKNQNHS